MKNINIKLNKEEFKKKLGVKDGKDGINGKDGRNGKDGKDGTNGRNGKDGKNGSPDTPNQVVEKVNKATKKIDIEKVKGLTGLFSKVQELDENSGRASGIGSSLTFRANGAVVSEHVTELNFTTNLTSTYDNNGRVSISASGGGSLLSVVDVTGDVNGSNTAFTIPEAPTNGVLIIVLNQSILFEGEHFTRSGANLTYLFTPKSDLSGKPHKAILY